MVRALGSAFGLYGMACAAGERLAGGALMRVRPLLSQVAYPSMPLSRPG
ncbi:hypothetical protein ABZV14_08350 [Streptosporangium canum]